MTHVQALVGLLVPCHPVQGVTATVPQSAPHLYHLPRVPCPLRQPLSPQTQILLDVQGKVINLPEELANPGHCITICLLCQGVAKFLPAVLSPCWNLTPSKLSLRLSVNMPVFVFGSPKYQLLVIWAVLQQQLAAYLLARLRLHFINRCQCCYDHAWTSDPHGALGALSWKWADLSCELMNLCAILHSCLKKKKCVLFLLNYYS